MCNYQHGGDTITNQLLNKSTEAKTSCATVYKPGSKYCLRRSLPAKGRESEHQPTHIQPQQAPQAMPDVSRLHTETPAVL